MVRKALVAAALLASVIAPLAASAGEVEQRVDNQDNRINQGVRSGSLTAREYTQLDNGVDRINAQRVRDLRANDGHLTAAERARLNREQNRLSDHIYFDKHNRAHQRP